MICFYPSSGFIAKPPNGAQPDGPVRVFYLASVGAARRLAGTLNAPEALHYVFCRNPIPVSSGAACNFRRRDGTLFMAKV